MQFETNFLQYRDLKSGIQKEIFFKRIAFDKTIASVQASCGCTKPVIKDNGIYIYYAPQSIPVHLYLSRIRKISASFDSSHEKLI